MLRKAPAASGGKSDCISTSALRMSVILSMCSMPMGHCSTQFPQVVQAHTASLLTASPISAGPPSFPSGVPARSRGPELIRWAFRPTISSFGFSALSEFAVGHWTLQRPHSMQAYRSRFCFS